MPKGWWDLLKLFAIRGDVETGGWENCSLLLRCCFRFCSKVKVSNKMYICPKVPYICFLILWRTVYFKLPTSVLTSSTDLKSLDIEASLDCGNQKTQKISYRQHSNILIHCTSTSILLKKNWSIHFHFHYYCSWNKLLSNTCKDTTIVLEWLWICRPPGAPRDLTRSCSCAICLFRLLMSCKHTHNGGGFNSCDHKMSLSMFTKDRPFLEWQTNN